MKIDGNFRLKVSQNIYEYGLPKRVWFEKNSTIFSIRRDGNVFFSPNIEYHLEFPERAIFKSGAVNNIGEAINRYGLKKGLLVTGKKAMSKYGVTQRVEQALRSRDIKTVLFNQVEPDPDVTTVDQGAALARKNNCDFVIGLGGGSVLDAAKMIAFLFNKEYPAVEYLLRREVYMPGLPIIAITTTGTGSEITNSLMLRSRELGIKRTVRDKCILPRLAIIDPELTITLPREFTIAVGVDSLVAPLEAYVGKKAVLLTDEFAFNAIRLVLDNLPKVMQNPDDLKAREGMSLASLLGAIAFTNSALGAVHGLANPFGTYFNLTHGIVCGTFLPFIMEYNLPTSHEKYARVAKLMGVKSKDSFAAAREGIEKIKLLLYELGIPSRLSDLVKGRSITEEDINNILDNVGGRSIISSP